MSADHASSGPPAPGGARASGGGRAQLVSAGVVSAVVGFASSFVLVLTGLRSVGADHGQAVSGLLVLCLANGALTLWLGLRYRRPLAVVWSTPGAALLVSAGHQDGGYRAAVGAFLLAGLLTAVTGLWTRLRLLVAAIPAPLATALLAGTLLPICLAPVHAAVQVPALALPVIAVWAVCLRLARRWAVLAALATAVAGLLLHGHASLGRPAGLLPELHLTAPALSAGAVVGIAVPLYVVTMASQNIPGLAVLDHFGHRAPTRPVLLGCGLATAAGAAAGGFMVNLAALTAALVAGPEAHPDRSRRWVASVTAGCAYLVLGLGAGLAAAFLTTAPPVLVEGVAGLALLPTLGSSLSAAVSAGRGREAAVLTFVVAASGVAPFGVGAPFWALLAGLLAHRFLPSAPTAADKAPGDADDAGRQGAAPVGGPATAPREPARAGETGSA